MRTEVVPPGAPSPLFVDFATFAHVIEVPPSILVGERGPPLVSETPNPTQHQERRLVTVLFADFVGFTSLAEDLDPEELQMLVSGIFEDLAEEALRYDGTIEKFIGDAIFVIFGAPIAHEDDPQRALRCALGMQRIFNEHAARVKAQLGIELGLRIGIHSGMGVAGAVRSIAEYGVMADTVNTASRLQQAAAPGEIYVTQATFRMTNREFSFREVGPIEMKGKDRPVLAYALTGERATPRTTIDIQAPLVGRWMELSRLDLSYQSSRVGRTEVVLIAGEPGIGKSRLLTEFIGLATSAEDGVRTGDAPRVLRWTFSRVNQRSYAGFIETLLVEMRIEPNDAESAAKLPEKLRELGFANPEMIAPTLAQCFHLAGATEPPSESEEWKRSMFLAVYDVIASLARERPLLYVLEDLHFADSASLELLWFVASRASRVPILLLLAQRAGPGSPEPRPVRTNFSQLVLEPLSDEEAARIIDATFDWIPDELRNKIVARAGGNPFFVEESIRSLVESGAVAKDEKGEWQLRERPAALEVPATLHGVVAARIDRLPPSAKETIQLASVIGQRFGDRVLREAGGPRVADSVDELYEKLDRFNDAIKALFLIARVRRYRGENDAALSAYERALAMLEDRDPKNPEVGNVIAHMAELCTRWDAKHPDLEGLVARGLAIVNGQRSRQKVLLLAAKSFLARKRPKPTDADWEEALATAKEALSIAEELGLLREVSLCLDAVGYAYGELGNFRESYAHNQRRLPIAKSLQDSDELIDAHNMIAIASLVLGDFSEGIEHATAGRDLAVETEKPRLGAVSLQYEALARLLAGDFAGALATAARRQQFLPTGKAHATLAIAAAAAAAMGSPEEKSFREQLIEAEASPIDLAGGDFMSAYYGMRESESSYHALRSAGYPKGLVDQALIGPLAVLAAARWRIEDQPFVERIEAVVQRTGHARGRALLTQAEGVRAMQRGELARAEKLIFDAVQAFATLRLDYERAVPLADHARVLAALGRTDHRQEIDEAHAIAERLGATALRTALEQVAVPS